MLVGMSSREEMAVTLSRIVLLDGAVGYSPITGDAAFSRILESGDRCG